MEYTVQKLARLAGVSARTIRYYDEIGLLKPVRLSSSGYRIYGRAEVDRLQQILLYRELGCSLEQIQQIIASPSFDALKALQQHRLQLLNERKRLDALIANVEKTIAYTERRIEMADTEKFEGFKQELIERNEQEYGAEVRAKYGDETVDRSNEKLMRMSQAEYEEAARLADDVLATLAEAFETGDPGGPLGQKTAELHKQWLCYFWPEYNKEAHAGLAQMYVDDERFRAYYGKKPGMAEFLRDAIQIYTGQNKA